MKNKLSTKSYKGVRDFYPEDKFVQKYIFEKMREVVETFGYEEYDASILEPTDLYKAKSGEEIISEQTYSFVDRGSRNITLRPEMTPTVARMIADKERELAFPLRWYSIVNNFRYERPQKGRLREFWQLNVDIFGLEGIEAEIETITIASKIMQGLGSIEKDFEIRISYSGIIGIILSKKYGLAPEEKKHLIRLVDRWNGNKISDEKFDAKMEELLGKERGDNLMKAFTDGEIRKIFEEQSETKLCREVINELEKREINNIIFDPFLVRGFDYYTGIVFEIFDKNPENNRAMFGGGRYDNLLDIFEKEKIPAVGFGMGDVPAIEFLKSRNLLPEYISKTNLYLCILDKKYTNFTNNLAEILRNQNLNVEIDYSYKKIDKQIKTANKKKTPFIICIGENEVKNNKFILKRMSDGKEFEVKKDSIKDILEEN